MKRIKITVLLILLCVLAGCSPKDTSLRAYCTESQQEFLDQSLEELPVALTYHHNDNILGRYETTDEEIINPAGITGNDHCIQSFQRLYRQPDPGV